MKNQEIINQLLSGNRAALGRAITLIESTLQKNQKDAQEIITACLPHSGKSIRIGITGVPGGNHLIELWKTPKELGKKVAVLG